MKKVFVLGIGPGSKDYLPEVTKRKAREAEIHIGGERALDLFPELSVERLEITSDLDRIRRFIEDTYRDRQIAVLVSGDPGLYSMLSYLKRYLPAERLEVVPGISSIQLAFARAGMDWHDARIISLHGEARRKELLEQVPCTEKVGLFTDQEHPPDFIARLLLEEGIENKKALVCENLSYDTEEIVQGKLEDIAAADFGYLSVMVIYDVQLEP